MQPEFSQQISQMRKVEQYDLIFRSSIQKIIGLPLILDHISHSYIAKFSQTTTTNHLARGQPPENIYLTYYNNLSSFFLTLTLKTHPITLSLINDLNANFLTNRNIKLFQNQEKSVIECRAIFGFAMMNNLGPQELMLMIEKDFKEMRSCLVEYMKNAYQESKEDDDKNKGCGRQSIKKVSTCKDIINLLNRYKNIMLQQIQSRKSSTKILEKDINLKNLTINPQISNHSSTPDSPRDSSLQYQSIKQSFSQKHKTPPNKPQQESHAYNKDNEDLIVKMITMLKKEYLEWTPRGGQNYGKVTKIKAEFQLDKFSMYKETNQLQKKSRMKSLGCCQSEENSESKFLKVESVLVEKGHNPEVDKEMSSFRIELLLLMRFRYAKCDNIASYYLQQIGRMSQIQKLYIEWYPRDFEEMLQLKNFKPKNYLSIFKNICKGVQFLWLKKVIHRDLKPSNIMLTHTYSPKIIDFGSSSPQYSQYCNLKKQNQLNLSHIDFRLISTFGYYYPYENYIKFKHEHELTRQQYEMHQNFDVYSLGAIMENIFNKQEIKENLGPQIYRNMEWLTKKCKLPHPDDRPNPQQINIFLKIICKLYLTLNKVSK